MLFRSAQRVIEGGAGVTTPELRAMVEVSRDMARQYRSSFDPYRTRAAATAKRYDIPEELIFAEGGSDAPAAAAAPGGGGGGKVGGYEILSVKPGGK